MKYRKKPVVIEAVQWDGSGGALDAVMALSLPGNAPLREAGAALYIGTLKGEMRADPGDWIIQGVRNEIYPCKPDIFEATYEAVEPDAPVE